MRCGVPALALSRAVESGPGGQDLSASAWQRLEALPDPRSPQGRIYPLACLVAVAVCAFTAAGNDRFTAVWEWIGGPGRRTWLGCALRGIRSPAGTRRRMARRPASTWALELAQDRRLLGPVRRRRPRGAQIRDARRRLPPGHRRAGAARRRRRAARGRAGRGPCRPGSSSGPGHQDRAHRNNHSRAQLPSGHPDHPFRTRWKAPWTIAINPALADGGNAVAGSLSIATTTKVWPLLLVAR
jgi:hypothetical protein